MFQSMHPVPSVKTQPSPRKNCCSSLSSLSSHAGRCSSESTSLGQISNSLNNMSPSPSSSSGRPSWRTIYLTMLVIFLAFSLQTAGKFKYFFISSAYFNVFEWKCASASLTVSYLTVVLLKILAI